MAPFKSFCFVFCFYFVLLICFRNGSLKFDFEIMAILDSKQGKDASSVSSDIKRSILSATLKTGFLGNMALSSIIVNGTRPWLFIYLFIVPYCYTNHCSHICKIYNKTRRTVAILTRPSMEISTKTHLLELSTVIHVVKNQIKMYTSELATVWQFSCSDYVTWSAMFTRASRTCQARVKRRTSHETN